MLQINKILFPTNCTKAAKKSFAYTLAVAKYFGASVDVLYVCEPKMDVVTPSIMRFQLQQEEKKNAEKELQEFVREFKVHNIEIRQEVELGFARENIGLYANKNIGIDLIVIGSEDNNSLAQAIWGTVISSMIEYVRLPVLVIPKGIVFQDIKNMAFVAPEFEDWRNAYPMVRKLAEDFNAKLLVTHLQGSRYIEEAPSEHVILEDNHASLHSFVYNENIHLLVTISSARNNIQRMLKYSNAQKMAMKATIPLLVLKK